MSSPAMTLVTTFFRKLGRGDRSGTRFGQAGLDRWMDELNGMNGSRRRRDAGLKHQAFLRFSALIASSVREETRSFSMILLT
jgi:hypothetical protein